MPRVYLPLVPLPVLAALVAVSACSKDRAEETTRVIPPAVTYTAVEPPPAPAPATATRPTRLEVAERTEDAPSEEELKEFERGVGK